MQSIQDSLLQITQQAKVSQKGRAAGVSNSQSSLALPNSYHGHASSDVSWYSRISSSLGSLSSSIVSSSSGTSESTKEPSGLSHGFLKFTFIPHRIFSQYMIEFKASWAQSNGLVIHFSPQPVCRRICYDETILACLGIKRCQFTPFPIAHYREGYRSWHECECDQEPPLYPDMEAVKHYLDSGELHAADCFMGNPTTRYSSARATRAMPVLQVRNPAVTKH
jgi:hypothetical protein